MPPVKTNKDPVHHHIWFIWLGGPLKREYWEHIKTAVALHRPTWMVQVVLSRTFSRPPDAYDFNAHMVKAAGAVVKDLEGPLARALEGEGMLEALITEWDLTLGEDIINFGAMSDILRIFLLKTYGGVYTDTDNTFVTPLPAKLVPKYGFQYGAFSSAAYKIADNALAQYTALATAAATKPDTVCNALLASSRDGQIVNAIWAWIKKTYVPLNGKSPAEKIRKLRWADDVTGKPGRLDSVKNKTLLNTGPTGVQAATEGLTIDGKDIFRTFLCGQKGNALYGGEGKELILDPKYMLIRSDNSWVELITAGLTLLAKKQDLVEAPPAKK